MLVTSFLNAYKPAIRSLPTDRVLAKEDLLVDDFLMKRSGKLEMYYAPHNEYIHTLAKVVIIGITPGWTQMKTAFHEAVSGLRQGVSDEEICRRAKEEAGFAGSMRVNLISMLDELGLHDHLNIVSCEELFGEHRKLLHTTSLLRYPVFVQKANYTGAHPGLLSNPFLKETAFRSIQEELHVLQQPLIIPLGKTVETMLQLLEREGKLDSRWCLWGFPHPSGANGHRQKQFSSHAGRMKRTLEAIFLKKS